MIYFFQARESKRIKIGYASNPHLRLSSIQVGNAEELSVLFCIEGDQRTEKDFHQRFAQYHVRGEWFECKDELKQYIEEHTPIGSQQRPQDPTMSKQKIIYLIWKLDGFSRSERQVMEFFARGITSVQTQSIKGNMSERTVLTARKQLAKKGVLCMDVFYPEELLKCPPRPTPWYKTEQCKREQYLKQKARIPNEVGINPVAA